MTRVTYSGTHKPIYSVVVVQLLNCVWHVATPWTVAHKASLSFTTSQNLLKLMYSVFILYFHLKRVLDLISPSRTLCYCQWFFYLEQKGTWLKQINTLAKRQKSQFSSVQSLSPVRLFATPWIAACQASLRITNSRSLPNSCPLSRWCHPTISSSVVPFSSCPQSFSASGSFQISQLFTSGGQSIGVSASTSVLSMNIQD